MSAGGQDEDQILFEDDFNLNYFGNNIMTWRRAAGASANGLPQQPLQFQQQQLPQIQLGEGLPEVIALEADYMEAAATAGNH